MPDFDAKEWFPCKGTYKFETTPRHMVDIWVSCTKTVNVFGVSAKGRILLKSGTEFRFRGQVKGFTSVEVIGTGETLFGLKVIHGERQNGEKISPEKPVVVQLPEASNLVLKMRQMAADHHRSLRMPVLEPEDGPSFGRYEVDDDVEDVLFEEEAYDRRVAQAKQKKAEEKAKQEEEAKGRKEPVAPPAHEPPESPQEPAKQVSAPQPPPPAKAAE